MCTTLVEALPEELKKSIHNLIAKTIRYIDVRDLPDKWPDPPPALLGQICFNTDPGQAF